MNDPVLDSSSSRRGFLGLCLAGGGSFGLVACGSAASVCNADGWTVASRPAGSFFDCHQMSVLSDIANQIVGEGDWPSVEETGAVRFIDGMIDEWAGPTLKARLIRLPGQLDRFAEKFFKRSYAFLEKEKRDQVLSDFDASAFSEPQLEESIGYREFKTLLLKIHLSSAEANRDFVRVPGTYHGDLSAHQYFEMIRDKAESFAG